MGKRYSTCRSVFALAQLLFAVHAASAQTLYLDSNGDGLNSILEFQSGNNNAPFDCVTEETTSLDIYLVTDKNPDGTEIPCFSSNELRTITSYQVLLRWTRGQIAVNGWTDTMGFGTPVITKGDGTVYASESNVWIGRGGESQPPGKYKLGTLSIAATGTPYIDFVTSSTISPDAFTGFGSACSGADLPGFVFYGSDFPTSNGFGTCGYVPVLPTTWGKIKQRYR